LFLFFVVFAVVFVLKRKKRSFFFEAYTTTHSRVREWFFCFSRGSFSFLNTSRILRKTLYFFASSCTLPFVSSFAFRSREDSLALLSFREQK
jgi:hypothetical protein